MSTCTDFVRGSGLAGSQTSPWVSVVESDTDQIVGDLVAGADICPFGSGPCSGI